MSILAAQSKRKPRRVRKPRGGAVHDFSDKRQSLKCAWTEIFRQQKGREIVQLPLIADRQHRSQALQIDIFRAHLMVARHC